MRRYSSARAVVAFLGIISTLFSAILSVTALTPSRAVAQ